PLATLRPGGGGRLVAGQAPGEIRTRRGDLEHVTVRAGQERGRLLTVRRQRLDDVVERIRDRLAVRVPVAEVGQERPAGRGLDAIDERRQRVEPRYAAVLPDGLACRRPVASRGHLADALVVDVVEGRDDVAPALRREHRPRVVEMAALQIAVVLDRGLVRDIRVALRARGMADSHLLVVLVRLRDGRLQYD